MKRQILLLAITAAVLSSCTTAYKTGQTPDDVYYSPARPQDEYVRVDDEEEKYRYNDDYYDDRYLRMKVQNRTRWNYLDDWYAYDRYGYRYNYYYGSYYNPYTSWNYYYNPYCTNTVVVYNPKQNSTVTNVPKPRNFNLNSYTNTNYNTVNNGVKMNSVKTGSKINRTIYNNSNSNNGLSNTLKTIFNSGGNNNSSNSSYSPPSRSYSPSSGSSSSGSSGGSSGSSSGGGGGASRPTRGGN
jgi:uncharacterized membrane protein YgcG